MKYLPHLIVLLLIFVAPAWDYFEVKRLKASADPRKRVRWYAMVISYSWILALGACAAFGWRTLFRISAPAFWLPQGQVAGALVAGALITGIVMVQVMTLIAMRSNEKMRAKITEALRPLYFILPVTREERGWWIAVSLTAGICEEIVYRGFLIPYFMGAPANLPVTIAMIASSLVFGLAHLYQGVRGAIGTAILGMVFAILFVMTGNLWVTIVLHALIDARLLLMIAEGQSLEPVTQGRGTLSDDAYAR